VGGGVAKEFLFPSGPVGPGSDITSKSAFLPVIECNGKLKRVLRCKTKEILEKSIQKIDLTINIT
jgi:hypothetical protein